MKRPTIIACGVLAADLKHVLAHAGIDAEMVLLPGGLHETPQDLKAELQKAISHVRAEKTSRIILGYGICGRGTIGLTAPDVPLVIPRVHDCIALFLGSDAAYKKQFAETPGTYYVSAGWIEEKAVAPNQPKATSPRPDTDEEMEQALITEYGSENAEAIRYFLNSWQRNYERAAFIDTGITTRNQRYETIARDMAQRFDWRYERLQGSHELLHVMLTAARSTPQVLVVPPGEQTYYDAVRQCIASTRPGTVQQHTEPHPPQDRAVEACQTQPARMTLGIDAGGTYTDAALFDSGSREVIASAKAPTTRCDLAIGISDAVAALPQRERERVGLVCLSTTLATNAIVENQGQKVGLIVMPPYGRFNARRFNHEPLMPVRGRLEIDGSEIEPVDLQQACEVARRLVEKHGVRALAVAGYASHANPAHEQQVAEAVAKATGLPVTCGHEVSAGLNYRIKAETAALNGRIIPCLAALLARVEHSLNDAGIDAPVMVVRSDGSLMSITTALKHPVQTIMSGPAASVTGAIELSGTRDAIVVDIGGTTTDTAVIHGGRVPTNEQGATVGHWRTHVRALDMRTLGLGGDSRITISGATVELGPRRVLPVSRSAESGLEEALRWIRHNADLLLSAPDATDILLLNATPALDHKLSERELAVIEALKNGPLTVGQIAEQVDLLNWRVLRTDELELSGILQRASLTPTDVLHAQGELSLWSQDVARHVAGIYAKAAGMETGQWLTLVREVFTQKLALALIKTQLAEQVDPDALDGCAPASVLLNAALGDSVQGMQVRIELEHPVVGIGAPASSFVRTVTERLHTQAIIPKHAEAANAVGAAASHIVVTATARIASNENGAFRVTGISGAPEFQRVEDAEEHARHILAIEALERAREAGTSATHVDIQNHDRMSQTSDGAQLFIERVIKATVAGPPDLARRVGASSVLMDE